MFTVILIIILVICVILSLTVLIQNPKGGGLSGTFGGAATQMFGYKRTSDDVEKITWGLAIAIILLSLATAAFTPSASTIQNNSLTPQAEQPIFQAPPENEDGGLDQNTQTPAPDQGTQEPLPTE
ncbi:MAG: preprotein translocase subunit SecG [Bacteroidetes bacterium]|nr:preprotein translocase subunit SecG [Bacteroidota bacterium]MBK7109792.1 preprotein translocase subunit SecG [Bacteroidota bacterium]MBK8682785.1 preprotein translocase subunit SecG [Bacteroidota bacterium]